MQVSPLYRIRIISWGLFAMYLGSLFLPYRLLTSGSHSPFQVFSLDSGIELVYPMFGLILVVPMQILYHFAKWPITRIWILVLSSLTFAFLVLITLQLSAVLYLRSDFQLGYYLNVTAVVGYFILAIHYFRKVSVLNHREHPGLLDVDIEQK